MSYDNVIANVGNFGRHQRRVLPVLLLPAIACAFHKMGGTFLAAKADFRCLLPNENPENATYQLAPDTENLTHLWNGTTKMWPQCEIPNQDISDPNHTMEENTTSMFSTVKCDWFVYDKTYYTQTVTTEWNLVCDNGWLKSLSESLFTLGDIPGSMIFGQISDRYGRKTALMWVSIFNLIFGSLLAVSPNSSAYMALKTLVGATTSTQLIVVYVTVLEMVGPKNRTITGVIANLAFTSGYILSAGLAYSIRSWRYLQIAFTIPTVAFLALCWTIPESGRWLLNRGRVQEAKDIIQKISSENGIQLPPGTLDSLLNNDTVNKLKIEKSSVFDLLRSPNLRNKTLLIFFMWLVIYTSYIGLSWNTSNLGGNDYVNFGIAGAVEIPAYLLLPFTSDRWGRKPTLCCSMLLAAVSLILTFFIPTGMTWLIILFAMIGKFAITLSFGVAFIFTAEQYPTANRNIALASGLAIGKMGAALSPFINNLSKISTSLPLVVFGSASLVAGLSSMLLPETMNKKLPESIQDAERLGRKKSITRQDCERFNDAAGK